MQYTLFIINIIFIKHQRKIQHNQKLNFKKYFKHNSCFKKYFIKNKNIHLFKIIQITTYQVYLTFILTSFLLLNQIKYALFLCGSAGAGKSTTTNILKTYFEVCKQHVTIFNLDPAADYLPYEPDFDIRELVTVNEVQEVNRTGPNGSLLFAFNYFFQNEQEILQQTVDENDFEDQILLIDCPGQIELYIQDNNIGLFGQQLQKQEWITAALYIIDSTKLIDYKNYLTNMLIAHSALSNLGMAFQIICSKVDLIDQQIIQKFETTEQLDELAQTENISQQSQEIYQDQNLVLLNNNDEDSITEMAFRVERLIHFQEE